MDIEEMVKGTRDAMNVKRVFGDPVVRNGVTVIPVANVMGGGGGGSGEMVHDEAAGPGADRPVGGSGGGFGVRATPAGVYVVKGEDIRWVPAVDATRIALMGQLVVIVLLLVLRSLLRGRTKS